MPLTIKDGKVVTVKQVIEHLQQFPEEMEIVADNKWDEPCFVEISDTGGNFCRFLVEGGGRSIASLSKKQLKSVQSSMSFRWGMCGGDPGLIADEAMEIAGIMNVRGRDVLDYMFSSAEKLIKRGKLKGTPFTDEQKQKFYDALPDEESIKDVVHIPDDYLED